MSTQKRAQLDALTGQIEEMWDHLATLFEGLKAGDGWDRKHGPDWTLADVPYHLAYCNRDIVARGLKLGPDYPETEQELLASLDALNAWNARKFAERILHREGNDQKRMSFAFRTAVSRGPLDAERVVAIGLLQSARARFEKDPDAAKKLLAVGASPVDKTITPAELAAWTSIASVILNLDETISKP